MTILDSSASAQSSRSSTGGGREENWVAIGRRLGQSITKERWHEQFPTFSAWVSAQAEQLGLKDASVWRYISAVRNFEVIRADLWRNGINCPEIDTLVDRVSPENIEILIKIRRVARIPDEEILRLSKALVDGTLRRQELRQAWARAKTLDDGTPTHRTELPVHAPKRRRVTGSTNNGPGSHKPRLVEGFFRNRPALLCGVEAPHLCRVFEWLVVRTLGPAVAASPAADWIVAIQIGPDDPMQYHGIYAWTEGPPFQLMERIEAQQGLFDSIWIYTPYGKATYDFAKLTPSWGHLEHSPHETLEVLRTAALQARLQGSQVVHLADSILARVLGSQVIDNLRSE